MAGDPLAGLRRALGQLAKVPSQASAEAADGINRLIQQEYDAGTDPYGRPWSPLKASTLARGRTPPPLTASRQMRDKTRAVPMSGGGIQLEAPSPANFHQSGTSVMAKRPILPEHGLPAAWKGEIDKAVTNAIKRTVK
jgi:hypothetical protein